MIGGISSLHAYYNPYQSAGAYGAASAPAAQSAARSQGSAPVSGVWTARRAAAPDTPVQPVRPAPAVNPDAAGGLNAGVSIRRGADPVEMAVRMRIQYGEPSPAESAPGEESRPAAGVEGAQKAAEEGECQTCKERKYQDGSDDMGVSFKTPTRIDPDQAASAVRGHEMEHVYREQAKARQENRRVVSQNVTYHTAICPECGRAYVSGGTTRTVTAANPEPGAAGAEGEESRTPFSAVA